MKQLKLLSYITIICILSGCTSNSPSNEITTEYIEEEKTAENKSNNIQDWTSSLGLLTCKTNNATFEFSTPTEVSMLYISLDSYGSDMYVCDYNVIVKGANGQEYRHTCKNCKNNRLWFSNNTLGGYVENDLKRVSDLLEVPGSAEITVTRVGNEDFQPYVITVDTTNFKTEFEKWNFNGKHKQL